MKPKNLSRKQDFILNADFLNLLLECELHLGGSSMKFYGFGLAVLASLLMVSCGSTLTKSDAGALKEVAPVVVDATIQRIGGKGATLNSVPVDLGVFATLPTAFARAYAPEVLSTLERANTVQLLSSSLRTTFRALKSGHVTTLQAKASANDCGQNASQVDNDQDGIPDLIENYVYDCLLNGVLTTGSISIKDNDLRGDGPYEVHIKQLKAVDQTSKFSLSLNLDLDLKSSTAPYSIVENISVTVKPDDTQADFATVGLNSSLKYTPDDLQNPFNNQGLIDLGASFNFAYKVGAEQANKTFKLNASVHKNTPACAGQSNDIDAGNVQFSDSAGNYLKTTSISCSSLSGGWGWDSNAK
jgi:hypothetical protein